MDTLKQMLKPGLIIDGQHRLHGAAKTEQNIKFLVCGMVDIPWKEQVFQFAIINDKAKKIDKAFITSLAAISLTSSELSKLQDRLIQAKVNIDEVEVMTQIGYDRDSPFLNHVDFKVKNNPDRLGYNTIKGIGFTWYIPKRESIRFIAKYILQDPDGEEIKSIKALEQAWKDDGNNYWFKLFNVFGQNKSKLIKEKIGAQVL